MSPITTFISLAALFVATISAMPTQVQERAGAYCPSGAFRMKYYYQDANGMMTWNGQYAKDLGGPLGSTSSKSEASSWTVDSSKNLIKMDTGFAGCLKTSAWDNQPANMTVFLTKHSCQANGYPMVECIKTPQYNMCWAGDSTVIQQCGQLVVFNQDKISSTNGLSCGPPLNFFIENC